MNFFNMIAHAAMSKLQDKFNPNSANFAAGGALGGMRGGQEQPGAGIGGAVDQSGPPMAAPGIQSNMATAQQETQARQMGFRSAADMAAWQRNRNVQNGANPTVGAPGQAPGGQVAPPSGPMAGHPANVFNYITNVLKNAIGGGQ